MNPYVSATIAAIDAFHSALQTFSGRTHDALARVESELRSTTDQVSRAYDDALRLQEVRRQLYLEALRAEIACEQSAYVDPQTGQAYRPDCRAQTAAKQRAKQYYDQSTDAVAAIHSSLNAIQAAADSYRSQAQAYAYTLDGKLPVGLRFLAERSRMLQELMRNGAGGGGGSPAPGYPPSPYGGGGSPEAGPGRGPERERGGGERIG